jgi:hypothetical protein
MVALSIKKRNVLIQKQKMSQKSEKMNVCEKLILHILCFCTQTRAFHIAKKQSWAKLL